MGRLARDEYLQSMRLMAWERAKGELRSIGQAAYPGGDVEVANRMSRLSALLDEFIAEVECNGLIE